MIAGLLCGLRQAQMTITGTVSWTVMDPGNAAKNSIRNPGVNNWDLSLSKRFPVKSDARYFQLRWEAYNAFNHTQYSGIQHGLAFRSDLRRPGERVILTGHLYPGAARDAGVAAIHILRPFGGRQGAPWRSGAA